MDVIRLWGVLKTRLSEIGERWFIRGGKKSVEDCEENLYPVSPKSGRDGRVFGGII